MINNINNVLGTEFDVIGGDVDGTSPDDPTFVYKQWTTVPIVEIDLGRSQLEYDRLNDKQFLEPYNTHVLSDRSIYDIDDVFDQLSQHTSIDRHTEYRKMLLSDRQLIQIDGMMRQSPRSTAYHTLDDHKIYDIDEFYNGLVEFDSDYLRMDYTRLPLKNRTIVNINTLGMVGDTINGQYTIPDPDPIEGELYKVFGTVQQLGAVPSYPTNVMIVNRSGGTLSTITVSPDPLGRFVKYYKDLPEGTTFMVIGLWDPEETPYFEPVIVDRVIATKL